MRLNGIVTTIVFSFMVIASLSYLLTIVGIPLPVFSLMCNCKNSSDNFSFTGTECPSKNHQEFA